MNNSHVLRVSKQARFRKLSKGRKQCIRPPSWLGGIF